MEVGQEASWLGTKLGFTMSRGGAVAREDVRTVNLCLFCSLFRSFAFVFVLLIISLFCVGVRCGDFVVCLPVGRRGGVERVAACRMRRG